VSRWWGVNRRRVFRGVTAAVALLCLALAATSPRQPGYWVALGVVIWWAAPFFGATSLAAMVARHAVVFGAFIVGIPFAVSSPHDRAFWVLLVALVFVLAPFLGVMGWFYAEIRRLLRERADTDESSSVGGHS
jgi:hypothetical protein